MSWITLTSADVYPLLSGPELEALQTDSLVSGQTDPLPEILSLVTEEVRAAVDNSGIYTMGAAGTIPQRLKLPAIHRIRFELCTRLPSAGNESGLLNEDRRKANERALEILQKVADHAYALGEDEASTGGPQFDAPDLSFESADEDGV